MSDGALDPYPFESDDDIEIGELELESVDRFDDDRITVGELVGEHESWRFGHVIVDEAQDLTAMQWRMIMRRVRGRSLTIVGDLAQRSTGEPGTWPDHLPAELGDIERLDLTINYRSPAEIHELAVAALADFAPEVLAARAIRSSGFEPEFHQVEAGSVDAAASQAVHELLAATDGQVAVIAVGLAEGEGSDSHPRVRRLSPAESKGLEFDAVVVVEPAAVLAEPGGPSLLYIALTRATQRLVIVHHLPLPPFLTRSLRN